MFDTSAAEDAFRVFVLVISTIVLIAVGVTYFFAYNTGYTSGEKAATISTLEGNPPFELVQQKDGSTQWRRVKE
jgi:heme/copper-type cytochrome/quinol oxidase subunit 2